MTAPRHPAVHGVGPLSTARHSFGQPHWSSPLSDSQPTKRASPVGPGVGLATGSRGDVDYGDFSFDSLRDLLATTSDGVARRRHALHAAAEFAARRARLSPAENTVLVGVVSGMMNKELAQVEAVSVRTIEQRRRRVYVVLGVRSAASLGFAAGVVECVAALESPASWGRSTRHHPFGQ